MGMDSLQTHGKAGRNADRQTGRKTGRKAGRQEENWIPEDYRGLGQGDLDNLAQEELVEEQKPVLCEDEKQEGFEVSGKRMETPQHSSKVGWNQGVK